MEIVESQFLNGWFFHYLKVSGIYFYGQPKVWQQKLPLAGRKRDFVPDMLQAVSAVCYSLLIIAMLADYALFYLEEIQTYDFFVVVAFINRIHYSGQVPLIFLACFVCRHRIRKLLRDVSVMASETMSLKDLQIWRNRNSAIIVMWLALCHGFHLLFISLRTIGLLENANDTVPIFGNEGSIRAPTLIFSTLSSASVLLSLNVDLAVQVFYFSVILIMIRILHNVHQVLAQLSGHDAKVTVRTEYSMVDWAANVVIRMRQLYKRLNRAFGYIIFLNCMRDLTAMVALMSVLLETDLSVRPGETPQQQQKRASNHDLKKNILMCEFFISISNAILRWTICAYSHKQSGELIDRLEIIAMDTPLPHVKKACEEAISKIDPCSSGISAAGFFHITKEYIAGVFGVFFTYAVLIYQARDSKTSAENFANHLTSDLKNSTKVILEAVALNRGP